MLPIIFKKNKIISTKIQDVVSIASVYNDYYPNYISSLKGGLAFSVSQSIQAWIESKLRYRRFWGIRSKVFLAHILAKSAVKHPPTHPYVHSSDTTPFQSADLRIHSGLKKNKKKEMQGRTVLKTEISVDENCLNSNSRSGRKASQFQWVIFWIIQKHAFK